VPANGGERRTTCASCGRQVATGARYCIHCGAEQSVPTPIAAVAAASIARRPGREAANAAHADPAQASAPGAAADSHDGALPPFAINGVAHAANSDQPTRPAYADTPRRRGLAVAVVAGLVAVAIVAAVAWRMSGEPHSVMTANAPDEAGPKHAPAQAAAPPPERPAASTATASPAAAPEAPPATTAETTPPEAAQPAPSTASTSPTGTDVPVEIKPLPPHSSTPSRPVHRAQPPKPPPAATATAQAPEPPSEPVMPKVVQAPTPVHRTAAPTAARAVDRWQRLDDELSRCTREDFITRVICGQRVRFRYCDGYWGKVPQCPGNTGTPDRGQ
jgi:S-DNA-T family DNA segregation ATPase FtsK/SpoIIIE